MGDELVQVIGDGADIFGNAPFIVVEDANEAFGGVPDVVERLERDAVGQGGVAENTNDLFIAAALIAGGTHAQSSGKGSAGVAGSIAVVLAFCAQRESIQSIVVRMLWNRSLRPVSSLCT
jgi:hypothetical protein